MDGQFWIILAVAGGAALASPAGGALAIWLRPTSLILSLAVGLAGGVLLGTFAFEMLPKALELAGLGLSTGGFVLGFALVYLLDLWVNRWRVAGAEADQKEAVDRFHRRKPPRGGNTSVLAGGTSAEELIEGLTIGIGASLDASVALIVALAIAIDNLSEGMSLGELFLSEGKDGARRRILLWTGAIGAALLVSALLGWFGLRGLAEPVQGLLFAAGAGGMFYLTVTDLVPEAESHQYQQSAAVAVAAGFILVMVLSRLV